MKTPKNFVDRSKEKLTKLSNYLVLFFLLMLAISLIRNLARIKRASLKINQAQEKVDKIKKENQELEEKLEIVKSEEFIEKQLRDKLGLAKEGEIVLVLPDEEVLRKFAPSDIQEEEALPDPNWKKWFRVFGFENIL